MISAALLVASVLGARGCLPVTGDRIVARDMAPAVPAFSQLPEDLALGLAPVAGARRYFAPAELQRLAREHGLSIEARHGLCFAWPLALPSRDEMKAAMAASLAMPEATIEILETSRYPAPRGEIQFARAGLTPPGTPSGPAMWRGSVRYGAGRKFSIWARVRVSAPSSRVIAVEPLRAGEPIRADQVRAESYEDFPALSAAVITMDEVVGQAARRHIATGKAISRAMLARPNEVAKGETVSVEARGASTRLTVEGRAEAPGRLGQVIPVRNLASGKTFLGRVAGRAKVVVGTAGKEEGNQ